MQISVFITDQSVPYWNFNKIHAERLQTFFTDMEVRICRSEEDFLARLPCTDIALIWYFKHEWLAKAQRLQWIVTPAAGRDYFILPAESGITVDYCSFHGEIMGETVLGMILAETRGIRAAMSFRKSDNIWPRDEIWPDMLNFRDSRLTILGFGNIGTWIAKLAKPFGPRITGVKRKPVARPSFFTDSDRIVLLEELDEVLPETDHLVICLPSGEGTTDVIDAKQLELLPSRAVIYNVGRGNAINEKALLKALEEKSIRAAYLDVFKTEPLPRDSCLRKCDKVIIMPHASAIAPNYLDLFLDEFIAMYKKKYVK